VPAKPGYMPIPGLGSITPEPPKDLSTFPRFPFVLVDDVPLDLTTGIFLAGFAEQPSMHFDELLKTCSLRGSALHPTDRPWEVLDDVQKLPAWVFGKTYESAYDSGDQRKAQAKGPDADSGKGLVQRQLLRLVRTAYAPKDLDLGGG
jgi:hypothetical protein